MAATLHTLDIIQNVGQYFVFNSLLYGVDIIYLTRQGVGMTQLKSGVPTTNREFAFKSTGLLAYKVFFFEAATEPQKIHIIYKT